MSPYYGVKHLFRLLGEVGVLVSFISWGACVRDLALSVRAFVYSIEILFSCVGRIPHRLGFVNISLHVHHFPTGSSTTLWPLEND